MHFLSFKICVKISDKCLYYKCIQEQIQQTSTFINPDIFRPESVVCVLQANFIMDANTRNPEKTDP